MAGRAPTAQEISTVLSRGYTQADIDRFNTSNPGDGGRILSAFPTQGGSSGGGGSSSSGGGGGGGATVGSTKTGPSGETLYLNQWGNWQNVPVTPTSRPPTSQAALSGLQSAAGVGGSSSQTGMPSVGGLTNVPIGGTPPTTNPNAGAASVNYGGAGSGGGGAGSINFVQGGPAQLRSGLGQRMLPTDSAALAGLRRAY